MHHFKYRENVLFCEDVAVKKIADEIGTPLCVTVDFDTLDDNAVTVRDRDTMQQERVPIESLVAWLGDRVHA